MSTEAPSAPQKINLRRPEIMEAVQAQVLSHYRSGLVERIRESGHILSAGDLTIKLAKEFGFCYGVERAIDLAYAARKAYPEAEALMQPGSERFFAANAEMSPNERRLAVGHIVKLYQAWDKPEKAAIWQKKLDGLALAGSNR